MTTHLDAACIPHVKNGNDYWYPITGDHWRDSRERTAQAKAICATCPLIDVCREAGWSEDDGIWAGLTPAERHARTGACGDEWGTIAGCSRHQRAGEKKCQHCATAWREYKRTGPIAQPDGYFACGHRDVLANRHANGRGGWRCATCKNRSRK